MNIYIIYQTFITIIIIVIFARYFSRKLSLIKGRITALEIELNEAKETINANRLGIEQNKYSIEENIKSKEK